MYLDYRRFLNKAYDHNRYQKVHLNDDFSNYRISNYMMLNCTVNTIHTLIHYNHCLHITTVRILSVFVLMGCPPGEQEITEAITQKYGDTNESVVRHEGQHQQVSKENLYDMENCLYKMNDHSVLKSAIIKIMETCEY